MSVIPNIYVYGTEDDDAIYGPFVPQDVKDRSEVTVLPRIDDGEVALGLRILGDDEIDRFMKLFQDICEGTDYHVELDWDSLDDIMDDFPYESLERPAGMTETRLLWPDD